MNNLRSYWNKSSSTIPDDKDPSAYAVEKEKVFPAHSVVCDLGSGSGADSLYFAGRGHTIKLIDISDVALVRAKSAASRQGLTSTIETYQCNLGDGKLPLQTESCNVVYSRLALHYFGSSVLAQLLAEVYRVLKPSGKGYLTLKSPDDKAEMKYLKSTAVQKEDSVFEEDGHIKTRFSVEELKNILASANLPNGSYAVGKYTENLGGRKDKVKSGNTKLIVNEVVIHKS